MPLPAAIAIERANFEAYITKELADTLVGNPCKLRADGTEYALTHVEAAWQGWAARAGLMP